MPANATASFGGTAVVGSATLSKVGYTFRNVWTLTPIDPMVGNPLDPDTLQPAVTEYKPGDNLPITSEGPITLYGVWVEATCMLQFEANGTEDEPVSGNVPTIVIAKFSEAQTLPDVGDMTRDGYEFRGWSTAADPSEEGAVFYRAGDEFHFSSNDAHTLYAVWLHPGDPDPENAAGGEGGSETETASLFSAGQVDPTMVPMMVNTLMSTMKMAAKQMSATEEPAAATSDETVVAPLELPVTLNNKELGTSTILTGANDLGLQPAAAPEPMAAAAAADEGGIAPLAAGDAVLHFDANGAEAGDAPADILGDVTEDATLPDANTMTRDGYVFSGWNTAADGSGTTYMAGDTFTFAATGTTTLYAVWMEEVITWEDGMVVSTVPPAGDAVEVTPPVYDTDGETVITPATYSPHQGQTITVNVYGPAPASAVATMIKAVGRKFIVVRSILENMGFTVVPEYDTTNTDPAQAGNVTAQYIDDDGAKKPVAEGEQILIGGTIYLTVAGNAPISDEGDKEPYLSSAYYSIMDVDHYEGGSARGLANAQLNTSGRRQNIEPYGMDFNWTALGDAQGNYGAHCPEYQTAYGSPHMPAVKGYTVLNNKVMTSLDGTTANPMGLTVTDSAQINWARADKGLYNDAEGKANSSNWTAGAYTANANKVLYAETGTNAIQRKPLVRTWHTISQYQPEADKMSDPEQRDRDMYFVDTEGDPRQLNVHVENRYWLNDQPYTWATNTSYSGYWRNVEDTSKHANNYATDGGQKGTLVLPVVTVVLPYGIAPYDSETGQPYTAHTVGDVQAVLVNGPKDVAALNNGKLADISPTLLDLLGIKQPAEMTGKSLLVRK